MRSCVRKIKININKNMTRIWKYIKNINRLHINVSTGTKRFSGCNDCPYYKSGQYDHQDDYQDIKASITKLIKENEKYFLSEIERTTIDHKIHYNGHIKTLGYIHKVAYDIFEKYGIFIYVSDLGNYIHSPIYVKQELPKLIHTYGIENVTEEIAIYLKNNHPKRFGIWLVCEQ
jgi:hypothetical protein